MEHTYQNMMMPASYAVLSEEEMTYLEGGSFSFTLGGYDVTVYPEILAQKMAHYALTISLNMMYLVGQGAVQYAFNTVTNGLADGLSLGGVLTHNWNKMNSWSKVATVGMGVLGGYYAYIQVRSLSDSVKNLVDAVTKANTDTTLQSAETGLAVA